MIVTNDVIKATTKWNNKLEDNDYWVSLEVRNIFKVQVGILIHYNNKKKDIYELDILNLLFTMTVEKQSKFWLLNYLCVYLFIDIHSSFLYRFS